MTDNYRQTYQDEHKTTNGQFILSFISLGKFGKIFFELH